MKILVTGRRGQVGWELCRSLQPLGLYAANSIFVGDYLTTEGQEPNADYQMIEDMGIQNYIQLNSESPLDAEGA